jgi:hypothetical protein
VKNKGLSIIFLDFTGTIDFVTQAQLKASQKAPRLAKIELVTGRVVEQVPERKPVKGPPFRKIDSLVVLKPTKKMLASGTMSDRFWENVPRLPSERKFDDYYGVSNRSGRSWGDDTYAGDYDYGSRYDDRSATPYVPVGPNKQAIQYLKQLVDLTGAKIVYSSTLRSSGWKSCADWIGLDLKHSLGGQHGVTPTIPFESYKPWTEADWVAWEKNVKLNSWDEEETNWKERGKEIALWFKQYRGPKVRNFVILDDDTIKEPELKPHWVSSIKQNGFLKKEYGQALKILSGGRA